MSDTTTLAPPTTGPRIISVGTANPETTYTQQDLLELFDCDNRTVRRFFTNSHIRKRHLVLPEKGPDGKVPDEDGSALLRKHLDVSLEVAPRAIERCLEHTPYTVQDIDLIATVTSTGMLCPSLSTYIIEKMGMRANTHRFDIVGMGCNAGMNGMVAVSQWAAANPGRPALLLCNEVCSAAYVFDMTIRTGVVNSLFGDGTAAALLLSDEEQTSAADGPMFLGFESLVLPAIKDEMRFDFEQGKFSFFLSWEIPYLLGETFPIPVNRLLTRFGLKRRQIRHWILHSGGKKVVDAFKYSIGVTEHDVRHTRSILRDYGNLSSASFLFSYQELAQEGIAQPGDYGMVIAMGPGVSIETGLLRW